MLFTSRFYRNAVATGIGVLFLVGASTQLWAGGEKKKEASEGTAVKVGIYKPRSVFQDSGYQQKYRRRVGQLQKQARAARKSGNRQKAKQLQQKMRQARKKFIGEFQSDVQKAAKGVADKRGLTLVVQNVVYQSDKVETVDLSGAVAKHIKGQDQGQGKSQGKKKGQSKK